jgi:hypothetical protein
MPLCCAACWKCWSTTFPGWATPSAARWPQAKLAAHSLKGSSLFLGIDTSPAQRLEQIGLSGDLTQADAALPELEAWLAWLQRQIKAFRQAE